MEFDVANLTVTTALWLLAAVLGFVFAWENLNEAKLDRREAENVGNGLRVARMIVANGYVFRERIRVAIFAWWMLLGVVYGFFEPPDIVALPGLLGLVVTAFGWTVIGYQNTAERRALRRAVSSLAATSDVLDAAAKITRKAEITAAHLESTAQDTAERLEQTADRASTVLDQIERTANNTERIAENTDALRDKGGENGGD